MQEVSTFIYTRLSQYSSLIATHIFVFRQSNSTTTVLIIRLFSCLYIIIITILEALLYTLYTSVLHTLIFYKRVLFGNNYYLKKRINTEVY